MPWIGSQAWNKLQCRPNAGFERLVRCDQLPLCYFTWVCVTRISTYKLYRNLFLSICQSISSDCFYCTQTQGFGELACEFLAGAFRTEECDSSWGVDHRKGHSSSWRVGRDNFDGLQRPSSHDCLSIRSLRQHGLVNKGIAQLWFIYPRVFAFFVVCVFSQQWLWHSICIEYGISYVRCYCCAVKVRYRICFPLYLAPFERIHHWNLHAYA